MGAQPGINHSNSQPRTFFNSANSDNRSVHQSRSDNNSFPNPSLTPYSCAFCSQSHDSASCQIVQDFDSRQRIVRENRLCLLCLQRGHIVAQCCYSRCSNCSGRHHVSLCGKLFPPSEPNANTHPETPVISVNPTPNPALSHFPRTNPVESVLPEIPVRRFRSNEPQEITQLPSPIVSYPAVSYPIVSPLIVSQSIASPIVSSIVSHPIVSHPIVSKSIVSPIVSSVVSSPILSSPIVKKSSSIPQDSSLNVRNPSDLVMVPHVRHRKWCRKKIVDRWQVLPLVNIGFTNLPQPDSPYDNLSESPHSSPSPSGCHFLPNQLPMEQRTRCKLKFLDLEPLHGQPFEDEYPDSLMTCSCPDVPNPNPPAIEEPYRCEPMVKERRGKVGMLATSLKPPILSHEFA
ncbi:unnamed protein product [Bursaphelenchus xylophilus]|uniref:(pine wood nematode) hypothetical protein n=1 Tax=Bursaphelenchus xylophilus TaxID=6326 RepID=A0A1I7SQE0_BURXY|nr:unnamed protein product [Bursaphelenchus xylophilus]CAG9109769.1 unnamed protein product [Bursaphelenchus xylophilus]